MDALREQYEGGFKMSAYKDKTQGTWYVSFRYIDWTGKKTQKLKRGFKTKKEASRNGGRGTTQPCSESRQTGILD